MGHGNVVIVWHDYWLQNKLQTRN